MPNLKPPVQLPLGISLREEARFENFISGDNGLLCETLKASASGHGEQMLYLWGGPGQGCSHLLQSSCHFADALGRHAAYLPLSELIVYDASVFDGLEQMDLVCLDDLQKVAGKPDWEEAVFHLFNRLRAANISLVTAATQSPSGLQLQLPDLTSRLHWGMVFQVQPLQEEAKIETLKARASSRGFELSDEVLRYIMHHGKRDLSDLLKVLDQLDHASLSAHRRITVPFVKKVMVW